MKENLARWLMRRALRLVGDPPVRIRLWNGLTEAPPGVAPRFTVELRDPQALATLLVNPHLYFGDAYAQDRIRVDGDLVEFLGIIYRSGRSAAAPQRGLYRLFWDWQARPRANTLQGSRRNVRHHYDLGNDFYRLWLDPQMQYTCAYYPTPDAQLEEAQRAKLDYICRKLQLRAGDRVVEAGCGWGGLARYMASRYGVSVRSYNIAHEQIVYAREQARALGLQDRVEYVEEDYRNIDGEYDVFVSVGMLEHVGPDNYPQLGAIADRVLTPEGRGLIHTIGRNRPGLMNPWIERRIFPGAYPPTLKEMMAIFEPNGFSVQDVENLRLHYARTLEHWLERFERHAEAVARMYDADFVRTWRLYLSGSIAAFTSGELQLFQLVFTRAQNNALPWTRAHLYTDSSEAGAEERKVHAA